MCTLVIASIGEIRDSGEYNPVYMCPAGVDALMKQVLLSLSCCHALWEGFLQLLPERTVNLIGDVSILSADEAAPADPHAAGADSSRLSPGDTCADAPDVVIDVES